MTAALKSLSIPWKPITIYSGLFILGGAMMLTHNIMASIYALGYSREPAMVGLYLAQLTLYFVAIPLALRFTTPRHHYTSSCRQGLENLQRRADEIRARFLAYFTGFFLAFMWTAWNNPAMFS